MKLYRCIKFHHGMQWVIGMVIVSEKGSIEPHPDYWEPILLSGPAGLNYIDEAHGYKPYVPPKIEITQEELRIAVNKFSPYKRSDWSDEIWNYLKGKK